MESKTSLRIGPILFSHEVQDISIQERKAIDVINIPGSPETNIVDGNASYKKIQIRLLIAGKTEISNKLSQLIALFKIAPITTAKNETISSFCKEEAYRSKKDIKFVSYNNQNKSIPTDAVYKEPVSTEIQSIPVALETLLIRTVPDLVDTISVELELTRVGIPSNSSGDTYFNKLERSGPIRYLDEKGGSTYDETKAYWLNKWVASVSSAGVDVLKTQDLSSFRITSIKIIDQTTDSTQATEFFAFRDSALVSSFSIKLRNFFAFHKIIASPIPSVQYLGSSNVSVALDTTFLTRNDKEHNVFKQFCRIKDRSEQAAINFGLNNSDTQGWMLHNGLLELVNSIVRQTYDKYTKVYYCPVQIVLNTGSIPDLKSVSIDFSAFTVRDKNSEDALLEAGGGYDYSNLKKFFEKIAKEEEIFRKNKNELSIDQSLAKRLSINDLNTISTINSFITFWSVNTTNPEATSQTIKRSDDYGLLNNDTLRAVLFTESLDTDGLLKKLLINSTQATGKIRLPPFKSNFFERFKTNVRSFFLIIRGIEIEDEELRNIYNHIHTNIVPAMFRFDESGLSTEQIEGFKKSAAFLLLVGVLGDYETVSVTSTSGLLVQALSSSKIGFTETFKQALFEVIVQRQETPYLLNRVYSVEGVFSAFKKLITEYNLSSIKEQQEDSIGITKRNQVLKNYPDLILPTYEELFRDRWEEFALTYQDVGLPNKNSEGLSVTPEDYVHPAIWFYNRKTKLDMHSLLDGTSSDQDPLDAATIAIPFDTKRLEEAEDLYDTIQTLETENKKDQAKKVKQDLTSIILEGIEQLRQTDPTKFQKAMTQLEEQKDAFPSAERVWLYVSYKDKPILTRKSTYPGLGGEIYRLAKERNYIVPTEGFKRLAEDTINLSSGREDEFTFLRNSKVHTEATIRSSIDQVDDIYFSYRKLFPCFKVFIVDDRGNDILASDSFFYIHRVISIDITQDKNDADLAVISIADPLQYAQTSLLPKGYVQTYKHSRTWGNSKSYGKTDRIVLDSLLNNDVAGYLERFLITYGRSIVIKAGYEANPKNLKTIFTGKISEIQPGDVLTIICQGWKSELINRQVSFYNDDPSTWGARDLAIQAIAKAAPEGLGQLFTLRETNAFLKGMSDLDSAFALSRSLQNTRSIAIDEYGSENILDSVERFGRRSIGLGGQTKRISGVDTRLKNIWYPDTPQYSNLFGWRSNLGCPPDYVNDSWVVPLKPAWEVLQEAARHAWNCVVQVVPYDSRATIFMGHPDQPYYYTRSNPKDIREYLNYRKKKTNNNDKIIRELINGFYFSKYYKNQLPENISIKKILVSDIYTNLATSSNTTVPPSYLLALEHFKLTQIPDYYMAYEVYEEAIRSSIRASLPPSSAEYEASRPYLRTSYDEYKKYTSTLPLTVYERVANQVLGEATTSVFLRAFYNIGTEDIYITHPGIDSIVRQLLASGQLPTTDNYTFADNSAPVTATAENILSKLPNKIILGPKGIPNILYAPEIRLLENIVLDLRKLNKDNGIVDKAIATAIDLSEVLKLLEKEPVSKHKQYETNINTTLTVLKWHIENYVEKEKINNLVQDVKYDTSLNLIQNLIKDRTIFRFFVYFFGMYILENEGTAITQGLLNKNENRLPPTMQVFRVHHYITSDSDILENNISASTKEMWNTIVIEHPAKGEALSAAEDVADEKDIFTAQTIGSNVQWQYWPKNDISGVIGLQFHPGLTLKNKKVQVKTELNAYSPELVAKLACNHLAEGIRKMYRGTLLFTGRIVKPYDRIILSDRFNKMKGPLEIESVVHHYSLNSGWVTNIIPEAVADANPGAAILQTAKLEAIFSVVFNAAELVTDALLYATIISGLSGATSLVAGQFSLAKGLSSVAKDVITLSPVRMITTALKSGGKGALNIGRILSSGKSSYAKLGDLLEMFSGPLVVGGSIFTISETLKGIGHPLYRLSVINSFIKGARELKTLPVVFSPLLHQDRPLVAGLETDSPVWDIYLNGVFYDYKKLQQGAEKIIDLISEALGEVNFTENSLNETVSRR